MPAGSTELGPCGGLVAANVGAAAAAPIVAVQRPHVQRLDGRIDYTVSLAT